MRSKALKELGDLPDSRGFCKHGVIAIGYRETLTLELPRCYHRRLEDTCNDNAKRVCMSNISIPQQDFKGR